MHPVENIRGSLSDHLSGRKVVLAVCGSIGAVKTVELARELIRHGAEVVPVMSRAAAGIIHPDAIHFGAGCKPILELTGAVEHVALLGDVPGKADVLLVAPATANTVAKMALGIDDTVVTTCATVAFGTRTPVVVAPAMHEAMLDHPAVGRHARTLVEDFGVTWVEPLHEEKKAKLAEVERIVEAVIHRLANDARRPGPLAGKKALVISGATAEPLDPVRVVTNRSSGRSGHILALELLRAGADVQIWQGTATEPLPDALRERATAYTSHAELARLVGEQDLSGYDQIWMPAAINDYAPVPATSKIGSEQAELVVRMKPLSKIIEAVRQRAPDAVLVAFKAESNASQLASRARQRMQRYRAQFVVANTADAFGAERTEALLVGPDDEQPLAGSKEEVLRQVVRRVADASRTSRVVSA